MTAETIPSREDALHRLDWDALGASARNRLRARLSGFSAQDVDDAAQDVLTHIVEFVRRRGLPERPEGLLVHIVRAVAADAIAGRQHDRAFMRGHAAAWLEQQALPADVLEVQRQFRENGFHILEYFRLKRAECVPLADARSRGESLKDHAARHGKSYDMTRQAWSRCVRLIHDAMRRNRLRLEWPTPRDRTGPVGEAYGRFSAAAAAHLADVLPDDDAAWMESHAAGCVRCSELLDRSRPLLPAPDHEAGHAPVSLLEHWVWAPEELTPLERALLERHFAVCAPCREDALEMARLAGIARTPRRAALPPAATSRPRPRPAHVVIVLRETLQGSTAESVVLAVVPVPQTVLEFEVPWLALHPTSHVALKLIGVDGVPIWTGVQNPGAPAKPFQPPVPPQGWTPGLYRLEVAPIAGDVAAARRSYAFRLIGSR